MSNTIAINLILGDRTYRIKIENTDEEKVREKAKKLNDQLIQFKKQYAGKDMQDYLAMVLLSYVLDQKTEEKDAKPPEIGPIFDRIESLLDKSLSGE
ncbi:MAG: cell division protein ZapA [Chitinophagaceae bacterium]|jgi:cell division protein ZapA